MGKVFINDRLAVWKNGPGMSVAFPDVCLCPPGPPAGPVPVPLTNTITAKDLANCAATVFINGQPVAHRDSYFAKSTGNEISRSTGGGVTSHAVQGKAYFGSFSRDVLIEGKPAVRHLDLVTHNHLDPMPTNCPPAVWVSEASPDVPPVQPRRYTKVLHEGKDWVEIDMVDLEGEAVAYENYHAKTPAGETLEGRGLLAGIVTFKGLAKGTCQISFPNIDANPFSPGRKPADKIDPGIASRGKRSKADKIYIAGKTLTLATGRKYRVELPRRPSFWLELTIGHPDAEPQGCAYVLRGTDGTYQAERTLADHLSRNAGSLVLEFADLMADKAYTLIHKLGKDASARVLFHDVPYERLRGHAWSAYEAQPDRESPIEDVTVDLHRLHARELSDDTDEEALPGFEGSA